MKKKNFEDLNMLSCHRELLLCFAFPTGEAEPQAMGVQMGTFQLEGD